MRDIGIMLGIVQKYKKIPHRESLGVLYYLFCFTIRVSRVVFQLSFGLVFLTL